MTEFYEQFPTLQSMKTNLDSEISRIEASKEELKHSPRYDSNESEREYQLEQLDNERENTLAKYEDNYQLELDALELSLAEQAFEMPHASEEVQNEAKATAQSIKDQMLSSFTPSDMLPLLVARVKLMTDVEKSALSLELNEIASHAHSKAMFDEDKRAIDKHISTIQKSLSDTKHKRTIKEQQEALYNIRKGASSLRGVYDSIKRGAKIAVERSPLNGTR